MSMSGSRFKVHGQCVQRQKNIMIQSCHAESWPFLWRMLNKWQKFCFHPHTIEFQTMLCTKDSTNAPRSSLSNLDSEIYQISKHGLTSISQNWEYIQCWHVLHIIHNSVPNKCATCCANLKLSALSNQLCSLIHCKWSTSKPKVQHLCCWLGHQNLPVVRVDVLWIQQPIVDYADAWAMLHGSDGHYWPPITSTSKRQFWMVLNCRSASS